MPQMDPEEINLAPLDALICPLLWREHQNDGNDKWPGA